MTAHRLGSRSNKSNHGYLGSWLELGFTLSGELEAALPGLYNFNVPVGVSPDQKSHHNFQIRLRP